VAKQVVVALFADANFFSANTPSAIRANSGLTQATPTQSTSYQLSPGSPTPQSNVEQLHEPISQPTMALQTMTSEHEQLSI
jgi:hypothetical protein